MWHFGVEFLPAAERHAFLSWRGWSCWWWWWRCWRWSIAGSSSNSATSNCHGGELPTQCPPRYQQIRTAPTILTTTPLNRAEQHWNYSTRCSTPTHAAHSTNLYTPHPLSHCSSGSRCGWWGWWSCSTMLVKWLRSQSQNYPFPWTAVELCWPQVITCGAISSPSQAQLTALRWFASLFRHVQCSQLDGGIWNPCNVMQLK